MSTGLIRSVDTLRPNGKPLKHNTSIEDDKFLSVAEAASYLGVTPLTIRNMLTDRRLRAYTLGRRVLRIRLADIHAALTPYAGEIGGA